MGRTLAHGKLEVVGSNPIQGSSALVCALRLATALSASHYLHAYM